ncbi:2-succinyl-6-hydroxy-2,4-cyclohexadiene-1-carboxylate synthase [Lactobacillus salsicarnum]|nr:2-succinyl-6-hydroxy-2,4-cyclohexadiene-1-carboxylate synthase [Companilactobacillus mishanensis]
MEVRSISLLSIKVNKNQYNYEANITDPNQEVYVFLHGFLGSSHDFDRVTDESNFQWLKLNLLGFGENRNQDVDQADFVQANQINDLESIFAKLKLTKINLVGYSMGGRIAIAYALKYQSRLNKLILESTTAGIEDSQARKIRQDHDAKLAEKVLKFGMEKFIVDWENMPLFKTQKDVNDTSFMFMHNQRLHQNHNNVAYSLLKMGTGSQPNYWPTISNLGRLKVYIIVGASDSKFVQIGERLSQHINNSQIFIVENAGHNVHFELPEEFNKIIIQ